MRNLIKNFHEFLDYVKICSFPWLFLNSCSEIIDSIWIKSSSVTKNILNTTLLFGVLFPRFLMCFLYLMQRRNFTLAFQAAESVGIKSTLVSFKYILNELRPTDNNNVILFCTFEGFRCFILKNSSS